MDKIGIIVRELLAKLSELHLSLIKYILALIVKNEWAMCNLVF